MATKLNLRNIFHNEYNATCMSSRSSHCMCSLPFLLEAGRASTHLIPFLEIVQRCQQFLSPNGFRQVHCIQNGWINYLEWVVYQQFSLHMIGTVCNKTKHSSVYSQDTNLVGCKSIRRWCVDSVQNTVYWVIFAGQNFRGLSKNEIFAGAMFADGQPPHHVPMQTFKNFASSIFADAVQSAKTLPRANYRNTCNTVYI